MTRAPARIPLHTRETIMRKPSRADAELLLGLYDMRREPELRKARGWFAKAALESPLEACATRHFAWRQKQIDAHKRRQSAAAKHGVDGARRARGKSR